MAVRDFIPLETDRLRLRRPEREDAKEIFECYASDVEVTRWLGWPRHTSLDDTHRFLDFSEDQWGAWPAGPLLIESKAERALIGSTGLTFVDTTTAMTGYVLSKNNWGCGYASEALRAMIDLSASLRVSRLFALCHPSHAASRRVLEKCGFEFEGSLATQFSNLPGQPTIDAQCYALICIR
jgi:ribosomal-protein-alanine N-acetyltransferase